MLMSVEVSLKISHKYPKIVSSEDFTYFTLFGKNGDQLDNTIDNLLLQELHFRPLVDPIILGKLETFPKGLSIRCQVKKFTGLYNVSLLSRLRDF